VPECPNTVAKSTCRVGLQRVSTKLTPSWDICRRGVSMLEMLIVVTILGVLAAIVLPRLGPQAGQAKTTGCQVNKGNIEIQAQLWFRNKGSWPAADLSDIGSNSVYFPEGLPTCPVDGSSYTFDSSSETVVGHAH
jgi:prepilin-type N-terminal cleavage/methylation domain-containing protein